MSRFMCCPKRKHCREWGYRWGQSGDSRDSEEGCHRVRVGDCRQEQRGEGEGRAKEEQTGLGLSGGESEEGRLGIWKLLHP